MGNVAQGRLYAAQMKLAHAAFKDGKIGGALALLRAQRPGQDQPDFRGFDWRYLYRLCSSGPGEIIATNASGYQSVDYSPDGRLLAFGDHSGTIYLWDLSGVWPLRPLVGHAGEAIWLAFSPDGRTLASCGMDHTIRLWHPEIDQEVAILTGHSEWVWCVAFADHGNALLSGSRDGTIKLWRALSFEEIQADEKDPSRPSRKDPI